MSLPSRFSIFSSSLRMSVAKASSYHSKAQFRRTFSVASLSLSSKLTMNGMKRAYTLSCTKNLRPFSKVERLTKMPHIIHLTAGAFSSRA